jgi:poly-gamma-glutamate biosynthesis protein PgsC/CapC
MIAEYFLVGIILGFLIYEVTGYTPGGIITPGYIALYIQRPMVILTTLLAAIAVYLIVVFLSRYIIIYGRRAFIASVLLGFALKWIIEAYLLVPVTPSLDIAIIGYIIPGLIANEIRKQGILATCLSTVLAGLSVFYLLKLYHHFVT